MLSSSLNDINRVYSPSRFLNEEDRTTTRPSSRASKSSRGRSAKSRSDSDRRGSESLLQSRSHTPSSYTAEENADDYYPKSPIQNHDILSIINQKIAKLDEVLHDFRGMRTESRSSNYESTIRPISSTKAKTVANTKEKENKEINQFAGIYSMKSVFFDTKINLPEAQSHKDENSIMGKPKLIELFQYTGFEHDAVSPLPHNIKINDVLDKVVNSIKILNKQPKYKVFLKKMIFTEEFKAMVQDVFYYVFLEKYQKNSQRALQHLFERISKNYVLILMMILDPVYKETFYKQFANLLAMSVYTSFTTCFPGSYTHFGHEFKETICSNCSLWINGYKPVPRSYTKWNFKMLDPPQAIFAEEVLTNKNKNILNFDITTTDNNTEKHANESILTNSTSRLYLNKTQSTLNLSTQKKYEALKIGKQKRPKKESHPACKGPEFEDSLFDLYGRSPLVDCFMYKQNARKLNTFETLISHPSIIALPPIGAPTYDDVIVESLKNAKKIEKGYKIVADKQKKEATKMANDYVKEVQKLRENEKHLLAKTKDVKYLGDLITMEMKKDPKSTSVGAHLALRKALKLE